MELHIGISQKNRAEVAKNLNILLANEFMLYLKTLNYHWHVVGRDFGPLHHLFRKQYEQLFELVDDIAERVQTLGFSSYGTMTEYLKHSEIIEQPQEYPNDLGMVAQLLADQELFICLLREAIDFTLEHGDAGTNNFLTERLEIHEKMAWVLRAHITV